MAKTPTSQSIEEVKEEERRGAVEADREVNPDNYWDDSQSFYPPHPAEVMLYASDYALAKFVSNGSEKERSYAKAEQRDRMNQDKEAQNPT